MANTEFTLNKKEGHASSMQPVSTIGNELRRGLAYHQSGQFEKAREIYAKILKVAPCQADTLNLAGVMALEEGNLVLAEEQIAAAIEADPSRPDFYNNLGNVLARQNHLNEAARSYQKAIALNPNYAAAYFNLGNVNQELKKFRQAIKCYCRTLEIEPDLARARYNLARAYRQQKHLNLALGALNELLELKPDFSEAYDEIASIYHEASQPDKAILFYEKSLKINPQNWKSYFYLGNLYRGQKRLDAAVQCFRKAVALNPRLSEAYLNLGLVQRELGNLAEAEKCYQRCTEINPAMTEAYFNLGNLYKDTGKSEKAIRCYLSILATKPDATDALNNAGLAYRDAGMPDKAVACFNRSLAANASQPEALYNLAGIMVNLNRPVEAISMLEKAVALRPDLAPAYNGLGNAHLALQHIDEAAAWYRKGLELDSSDAMVWFNLGIACQKQGRTRESKTHFKKAFQLNPRLTAARWHYQLLLPVLYTHAEQISFWRKQFENGLDRLCAETVLMTEEQRLQALAGAGSRSNYYLACQGRNDLALQKKYGKLITRIMAANYPQWSSPRKTPAITAENKIRLGFVSPHMYSHTVGAFLVGWVKHMHRREFEVFGYYLGYKTDAVTSLLKNHFDHFYQINHSVETAAKQISADNLHILVFFDIGMTPIATQLAALRLAAIQCKGWGYPVTTGLPTIDYYLSSDLMEPQCGQQHYSEELIRLPNLALCLDRPALPKTPKNRDDFGIEADAFVYLSIHSLFTYLPQYDEIFSRIALAVANAKFVFISHQSEFVTKKFRARLRAGFKKIKLNMESYCHFLPRLNLEDFLSLNLAGDVLLDTPSWSGGKTSIEAIGCGLPVVTVPGEFMRGRHAYAMLKMIGVYDTIAKNIDDYVDIAIRLGKDKDFYKNLKAKMKTRAERLFDDHSVPDALEVFFQKAVMNLHKNEGCATARDT